MPEEAANVNVTSALPDDIRESVAVSNLKALGEGPAFFSNLAMANAVNAQQALTQLGISILAKSVDLVTEKQIEEGGVLAAALQQITKAAQTTPPPTA